MSFQIIFIYEGHSIKGEFFEKKTNKKTKTKKTNIFSEFFHKCELYIVRFITQNILMSWKYQYEGKTEFLRFDL